MKRQNLLVIALLFIASGAFAQTAIISTNPTAENILLGKYNPQQYRASQVIQAKTAVINTITAGISQDSLQACIEKLGSFYNRNTGSDTISNVKGIGAARRWVYKKFQEYSAAAENRLIPSYLQFTQSICSMNRHRNVYAVLPGTDTASKTCVIIEGHIDSRCENECDTACKARGIEDNATGTALVMELARVMSKCTFKNSVVFAVVIGEEQGLYGANAFAVYAQQKKIKIKAVLNNDVIGGIYCGKTASPPTDCVHEGDVDSLNVRIFSAPGYTSPSKGLARFAQVEFNEELRPLMPVKMNVKIMSPLDRSGRGGDHQPFINKGYLAIRYTAAHEHGNANAVAGYTDRQHSFRDTMGVDTDNDGIIDSMYISMSYLARNTVINGVSLAMAAMGPNTQPSFTASAAGKDKINILIKPNGPETAYKISVRRTPDDYNTDRLYVLPSGTSLTTDTITCSTCYVSVASIGAEDIESIFTPEQTVDLAAMGVVNLSADAIKLWPIQPNPAHSEAEWPIYLNSGSADIYSITVNDITGRAYPALITELKPGDNTVKIPLKSLPPGMYLLKLSRTGEVLGTGKVMVR